MNSILRLDMETIGRFFVPPSTGYFLFGPRGTGKSVFTRMRYPEAFRLDLLQPDVQREYAARPERSLERLAAEPRARQVVIGEVQRVPELLSVVHSLIESDPGAAVHLEDLLLTMRLPVFTRRARRELSAHPKLFLFDAGVFGSLRPSGPLDLPEQIEGAALEGLVAQHLRAWIAYRNAGENLHFWRTRSGLEVDFVICGPETLVAVEVKNTASVRAGDLRGLRAFGEDYPQSQRLLLYRGKERLKLHEILCLPCEVYLRALRPAEPMPS